MVLEIFHFLCIQLGLRGPKKRGRRGGRPSLWGSDFYKFDALSTGGVRFLISQFSYIGLFVSCYIFYSIKEINLQDCSRIGRNPCAFWSI